jgi:pyruvate,orthophosphate dikinase
MKAKTNTTPQVFLVAEHRRDGVPIPAEAGGNKGANLSRLASLGLPVPPAIVLSTEFCQEYFERRATFGPEFSRQLGRHLRRLEEVSGLRLGGRLPLLVSVRSSPPVSMPGMLDTVLNVGLTESTIRRLIRTTGNPTLVWDAYRRLIRSFAETVHGTPLDAFDELTARYQLDAHVERVQELDPLALRALARDSADLLCALTGQPLPVDPLTQVACAVEAVFQSWNSPRATAYRRLNGLEAMTATAVIIQAMVFGNAGGTSGSGVGFTRDPTNGEDRLYLDFLFNAQGEDVVSGRQGTSDAARLSRILPDVHAQLDAAKRRLEFEFGDMQDFEFTVQEGRLYFLQTRTGKRTPWAAVQIAVDLVSAGIIDSAAAVQQLTGINLDAVERTRAQPALGQVPIATGTPAGLGVAVGMIALDSEKAQQMAANGPVVLVRSEMTPNDIMGLAAATGALTKLGGRTSHAAVVARQMGKVCVVGCRALRLENSSHECLIGDRIFHEGELITIDGDTGHIYAGPVTVAIDKPRDALATIARWRHPA